MDEKKLFIFTEIFVKNRQTILDIYGKVKSFEKLKGRKPNKIVIEERLWKGVYFPTELFGIPVEVKK